jgi:hypothetical protein
MRLENKAGGKKIDTAHWGHLAKQRQTYRDLLGGGANIGPLNLDGEDGPELVLVNPIQVKEEFYFGKPTDISGDPRFIVRIPVITVTSKMNAPSFSLTAGPEGGGGSCPASNYSEKQFNGMLQRVEASGGDVDAGVVAQIGHRVKAKEGKTPWTIPASSIPGTYICDTCYAGKGRYWGLVQFQQMGRRYWVEKALADGSFVEQMVASIRAFTANDAMCLAKLASTHYFRIHDSGDHFSPAYLEAWFQICEALGDMKFWCPTRIWATPGFFSTFNRPNGIPRNLSLRPSQFVYSARAPLLHQFPGMAAGSTSAPHHMAAAGIWDCPAYQSLSGTCAESGCRVCWDRPETPVSYMAH